MWWALAHRQKAWTTFTADLCNFAGGDTTRWRVVWAWIRDIHWPVNRTIKIHLEIPHIKHNYIITLPRALILKQQRLHMQQKWKLSINTSTSELAEQLSPVPRASFFCFLHRIPSGWLLWKVYWKEVPLKAPWKRQVLKKDENARISNSHPK